MQTMDGPTLFIPIERNIFTSRTLNMRSIQAIGYDMDYKVARSCTLVIM
jgi:hypothetical protein